MSKIKILVTGATGFVGNFFCDKISREHPNIELTRVGFNKNSDGVKIIDLTNIDETKNLFKSENPTHVFHFAAMVNPKLNEENKIESYKKNFIITNNIVAACSKEAKIYFLSTDKVYNASNKNSNELDDIEIPDNFYSLMKVIGEKMISANFENHFILRCPIIHSTGNRFSNSFIDSALIKLKNKEEITVFDNIIRHYILVEELVDFLITLIESNKYGTYNIGTGSTSYYNRILKLAENQGLDTNLICRSYGTVIPQIQTYNLDKLSTTFNKYFQ